MKATAVLFDTPAGPCAGWFHPPEGAPREVAVLMCRPLGYEALCSYSTYAQLARAMAEAGFAVLRFDYHGTGDSAGGDADPDRVEAWLGSIAAARDELLRLSGAKSLSLFGMRLGACLAIEAARRDGGVASLMLWAPCASGRAFVREMRAANASRVAGTSHADAGDLEALGSLFGAQTLARIGELDPARLAAAPAPQVLLMGRDDLPGEGPMGGRLRQLGAQVSYTTWAGYGDMMAEPHDARLTPFAVAGLVDWLSRVHPECALAPAPAAPAWPTGFTANGVHEIPLAFGARDSLFGVLSEPGGPAALGPRTETAVLMLNVGGNYHVGCNRVYVKMARELALAGYRALRMDVAGIGDSEAGGTPGFGLYRHQSMEDVRAAMDALAARGCKRFWLLGICSGSYLAFETALLDTRVDGQMLLNSRLLEWDATRNGPWQTFMQQAYKSTRYYRKALLRADVYARLLRGEINVRGVAQRLWSLARVRIDRVVDRLMRRVPREGVLAKMRHLCKRGVDSFVIVSSEDDSLDYIEFHLGRRGARLKGQPYFRMALVEDSDHTFSTVASQRALIDLVRSHLDGRHQAEPTRAAVPTRVATT